MVLRHGHCKLTQFVGKFILLLKEDASAVLEKTQGSQIDRRMKQVWIQCSGISTHKAPL